MGRQIPLIHALKALDLLILLVWFGASVVLSSGEAVEPSLTSFLALRFSLANILLFGAFALLWHLTLAAARLYDSTRVPAPWAEALAIAKATAVGAGIWLVLGALFDVSFLSLEFLLVFWLGAAGLSIGGRLLIALARKGFGPLQLASRRILIVGVNPRSLRLARALESESSHGYELLGFADDASMASYPLVAETKELPEYLRSTPVDEVLICLPLKSRYEAISRAVAACEQQGIMARVLADLFDSQLANSEIEQLGSQSLITLYPHTIVGIQGALKRSLDFAISAVLMVFLLPVFFVVACLIKLSSRGPVFFRQERLGLNKKRFEMLKFRTMVDGAEHQQAELEHLNEADGPVFKINHDPRITPVGRFLRRTSFDELPQFINVIKGEMSLVGPRPLPVRDYEGFSEDWHRRRFSVRPGISGLWQINGRSSISFQKWMELDLQYINEWSLMLDLKVLLKTVPAVIRGTGAA